MSKRISKMKQRKKNEIIDKESVQFICQVLSDCDPMDCSTPGLPVHHQLPEFTQTHLHWVSDAIQPSHPLWSPSPPISSLSGQQGLFQWVSSSHRVAQSVGVSASTSVLPMNTQDWSLGVKNELTNFLPSDVIPMQRVDHKYCPLSFQVSEASLVCYGIQNSQILKN